MAREEGRKIHSFYWHGARFWTGKSGEYKGAAIEVEIRMLGGADTDSPTFKGVAVEHPVTVTGTDIIKVRDECFSQLEKLHPIEWKDKLQIVFDPDSLFYARSGLEVHEFQIAETKLGPIYRSKRNNGEWGEIQMGELKQGKISRGGATRDDTIYIVCDPNEQVQLAVDRLKRNIAEAMKRAKEELTAILAEGGVEGLLGLGTKPVLALEAKDVTAEEKQQGPKPKYRPGR
jgi:hypothetical protein